MKTSLENSVMFKTSSSEIAHYGKISIAVFDKIFSRTDKIFYFGRKTKH